MTAAPLLRSARPVTLVGAGPCEAADIAAALAFAPVAVAADGGADRALPAGATFAAVIGDMDSQTRAPSLAEAGVPVHAVDEQNSTDLEKCLYSVAAPLFLGVGFLGGRLDHGLAAMSALLRYRATPVVLLGGGDIVFACPDELALDLPEGTRVSLFPLAPVTGRRSEGLRWSVAGLPMRPGGRIGTSNAALGGPVRIAFDAPGTLVILPGAMLARAVTALAAAPDPVRRPAR